MKALVLIFLVLIVGSLGHALSSMTSGASQSQSQSQRMARALTVRVTLSVALFALLLVGHHFGWIEPRGMH